MYFIRKISKSTNAKTIGWNSDAWNSNFFKIFDFWRDHVDLILHSDTNREFSVENSDAVEKLLWIHHLSPHHLYNDNDLFNKKRQTITFSGSLRIDRLISIIQLLIMETPIEVFGGYRLASDSLSLEGYIKLIEESAMVFCPATNGGKVMTGRFLDAIAAGALAIGNSGATTDDFFIPYAHYIPYKDMRCVKSYTKFMLDNPDVRADIASRSRTFLQEHYSHERYWRIVLKRLFG